MEVHTMNAVSLDSVDFVYILHLFIRRYMVLGARAKAIRI